MVQGPQDLRNNMVVSFLGFLIASTFWTMAAEASNLELPTGTEQKKKRKGTKSSKKSLVSLAKGTGKGWPSRTENLFDNTHPTPGGPNRELIFHPTPLLGPMETGSGIPMSLPGGVRGPSRLHYVGPFR